MDNATMTDHAEYRELRELISVLGGPEAQAAADSYLIGLFVRNLQRV
jgi:hypothetical protein